MSTVTAALRPSKSVIRAAWDATTLTDKLLGALMFLLGGAILIIGSDLWDFAFPGYFAGTFLVGLSRRVSRARLSVPSGLAAPPEGFIAAPLLLGLGTASFGFAGGAFLMSTSHGTSAEWVIRWAFGAVVLGMMPMSIAEVGRSTRQLLLWGQQQASLAAVARADADRARVAALQAQMNPHFLFNALNTVASLLATDASSAARTVGNLSSVLRKTLGRSTEPLTTLDEELAFVREYLEIERERFGSRLTVTFDVDPATTAMRVPTMSLQPLVENAIKYALSERIEGGHIRIASGAAGGRLHVSVQDDGPGSHPVSPMGAVWAICASVCGPSTATPAGSSWSHSPPVRGSRSRYLSRSRLLI